MKSAWNFRGQHEAHQIPVEMRFIDMFMTTLGALVFLALTLVYLLPTKAKEEAHRFDKEILQQWFSVLIIADKCGDAGLDMYVKYGGPLLDWDSGKFTGRPASPFDVIRPSHKEILAGNSYSFLGREFYSNDSAHTAADVDELSRNQLGAMFFFGMGAGEQPFSVYVAATDPGALQMTSCMVRPIFFAWNDLLVGERVNLTKDRPFAWLQRFSISANGGVSANPPLTDTQFQRDLWAFSEVQSGILCNQLGRCGTEDAQLHRIRNAIPPTFSDAAELRRKLIGLYQSGRYSEARDVLKTRSFNQLTALELVLQAAVYSRLGQSGSVPAAVGAALARYPHLSVEYALNITNSLDGQLMTEMMQLSDFPECASDRVLSYYENPVRLPDCTARQSGLEVRNVRLTAGGAVREELLAQGVRDEDARSIESAIHAYFAVSPGGDQELKMYFDSNDESGQPVQIGVYKEGRYIGAIALTDNGSYEPIDASTDISTPMDETTPSSLDAESSSSRVPRSRPIPSN